MRKEVISDYQGISLLILFIIGTSVVIISGLDAQKDLWIANIVALLFAIPIALIYVRLHSTYPGKDLIDIFQIILGKYLGKFISLLYIWFAFHLCTLIVRDFGEFYITVAAPETPMLAPMIIMIMLGVWLLKSGLEVFGKCSEFFLPFLIISLFFSAVLLISEMDINNILPILSKGVKPVIKGALGTFSFPFGEIVVFTLVFSNFQNRRSPYKIYLWGLILGGIVVFVNSLVNLLVLGVEQASVFYFPYYSALSRLNIRDFLQRVEIVISFVFVLGGFIKMNICFLAACKGITKLFGFQDYKFIVIPAGFMLINLSYLIFDSIMDFLEWSMIIWPYYAFLFQVIIPVSIFIISEIKTNLFKLGNV